MPIPNSFERCSHRQSVALIAVFCLATCGHATEPSVGSQAGEVEVFGGLSMHFCWCPAGKFMIGTPTDVPGRPSAENYVAVTLTRGFWLGKYEVTQYEYERVMDKNPSFYKGSELRVGRGGSWFDSGRTCRSASRARLKPTYRNGTDVGFRVAVVMTDK